MAKQLSLFFIHFLLTVAVLSCSTETITYPDGFARATPESQGVKSQEILNLFTSLQEKDMEIHGLMILRHDKVIAEHWCEPYCAELPHSMYSSTKTFTATIIGFAVQEGLLNINDRVMDFFPDLLPETIPAGLEKLTVFHLLSMSAGHADSRYAGSGLEQVASFLRKEFAYEPGTHFEYNVTCSHMLSCILTKVTGISIYDYAKPRLFDPLGIDVELWEMDDDGHNMGNGGLHLRTSDLAKLGTFLKNGGKWDGVQLLNQEWIDEMTTPQIMQRPDRTDEENATLDDTGCGYGYQTWMGRHHSYRAIGASNQVVIVFPDEDMVVTAHSAIRSETDFNNIVYALVETVSDSALPESDIDLNAELEQFKIQVPIALSDTKPMTNCTRIIPLEENTYGIKTIRLRFDMNGDMQLTFESASSVNNINFGYNSWKYGSTDRTNPNSRSVYPNTMNVTPYTTAGICSWDSETQLTACYISMFNINTSETFVFDFSQEKATMTIDGRTPIIFKEK